ncbi:MAG: FG-GAP repeat domain-containing protein [Nannocystales bacterium]
MRVSGLLGICLVSGCLVPNPEYLGQSGATGTDSQSGTATGNAAGTDGATTLVSGSGTANSGTSARTATTDGPDTGAIPCSDAGCVQDARCYDAKAPSRVALGDVDGDGRLDVVSLSFETEVLQVWSTGPDGELTPLSDHEVGAPPLSLAVFDTNADERADLVVGVAATDAIVVVDAFADTRLRSPLAGTPVAMVRGDGNLDSLPDMVVATGEPHQITWALSGGDGTFKLGPVAPMDAAPGGLALGLADADDIPDAFVLLNSAGQLGYFHSTADAGFEDGVVSGLVSRPYALDTAHLDHDARLDVVVTNSSPETIEVMTGNGTMVLSSAQTIALDETPGQVQLADIDLDGEPEIIVAMQSAAEVRIFPGTPDLQYGEPIRVKLPDNGDGLAVGDLNGDGQPDIVASVHDGSAVCVLLADSA